MLSSRQFVYQRSFTGSRHSLCFVFGLCLCYLPLGTAAVEMEKRRVLKSLV